ncbi:MAG: hypothetical protein QMD61_07790 [Methanobacterium sp.]|nr:hypothetical protein [Methanobacterium sp.]
MLFYQYKNSSKIEKRNMYIKYDKIMQGEDSYDENLEYDKYTHPKPLKLKSWLLYGVLPLLLIILLISKFVLPLSST